MKIRFENSNRIFIFMFGNCLKHKETAMKPFLKDLEISEFFIFEKDKVIRLSDI